MIDKKRGATRLRIKYDAMHIVVVSSGESKYFAIIEGGEFHGNT